ncbi:hypothetical protein B0F90DRAFT_1732983 [Multifurca ochricompacta]|uniref:Uncharacterized protein n=1 Tax=Multifurca ochricompacta TaxID=376703 RepID=A0AAD4M3I3_9AGAM|nr:hypothetical protein B0F90DRAFT_1732983 [Multifurca ochricompacta]
MARKGYTDHAKRICTSSTNIVVPRNRLPQVPILPLFAVVPAAELDPNGVAAPALPACVRTNPELLRG